MHMTACLLKTKDKIIVLNRSDFYKKNQYYTTIDFKRYISTEDNSCRDESTKDEGSLMRLV